MKLATMTTITKFIATHLHFIAAFSSSLYVARRFQNRPFEYLLSRSREHEITSCDIFSLVPCSAFQGRGQFPLMQRAQIPLSILACPLPWCQPFPSFLPYGMPKQSINASVPGRTQKEAVVPARVRPLCTMNLRPF